MQALQLRHSAPQTGVEAYTGRTWTSYLQLLEKFLMQLQPDIYLQDNLQPNVISLQSQSESFRPCIIKLGRT